MLRDSSKARTLLAHIRAAYVTLPEVPSQFGPAHVPLLQLDSSENAWEALEEKTSVNQQKQTRERRGARVREWTREPHTTWRCLDEMDTPEEIQREKIARFAFSTSQHYFKVHYTNVQIVILY